MNTDPETKPAGSIQNFCSNCGSKLTVSQPEGDNKLRYVCADCDMVHYENPKMVVGCVVSHHGKILLCRRGIEPRANFWTVPGGFMELNETVAAAAMRETYEEALAEVKIDGILAIIDVVHARQAHIFFHGTLKGDSYGIGEESIDTKLFTPADIPWNEIAFPSGIMALKHYLQLLATDEQSVLYAQAGRINHA